MHVPSAFHCAACLCAVMRVAGALYASARPRGLRFESFLQFKHTPPITHRRRKRGSEVRGRFKKKHERGMCRFAPRGPGHQRAVQKVNGGRACVFRACCAYFRGSERGGAHPGRAAGLAVSLHRGGCRHVCDGDAALRPTSAHIGPCNELISFKQNLFLV